MKVELKNLRKRKERIKRTNWTTDRTQKLSSCLIAKIVSTNIKVRFRVNVKNTILIANFLKQVDYFYFET